MGRRWGQEFDEDQIRRLICAMTPQTKFSRVLREELKAGRWKALPRGKPGEPLKRRGVPKTYRLVWL